MHIKGSRELTLGIIVQANISNDGATDYQDVVMNQIDVGECTTYAMIVLMTREEWAWNVPLTDSSEVSTSILLARMDFR